MLFEKTKGNCYMGGACLDLLQNSGIKRCKTTVYIEYHNSKRLLPPSQNTSHLGFKICPKKQITLLYLESTCACKNQLVPNIDNI